MARESCVFHNPSGYFVKIREDYIKLFDGDLCCAILLYVFEFATNGELHRMELAEEKGDPWIKASVASITLEALGMYSERSMYERLAWLESIRLVQVKRDLGGAINRYLLNYQEISEYIKKKKVFLVADCKIAAKKMIEDREKERQKEKKEQTETLTAKSASFLQSAGGVLNLKEEELRTKNLEPTSVGSQDSSPASSTELLAQDGAGKTMPKLQATQQSGDSENSGAGKLGEITGPAVTQGLLQNVRTFGQVSEIGPPVTWDTIWQAFRHAPHTKNPTKAEREAFEQWAEGMDLGEVLGAVQNFLADGSLARRRSPWELQRSYRKYSGNDGPRQNAPRTHRNAPGRVGGHRGDLGDAALRRSHSQSSTNGVESKGLTDRAIAAISLWDKMRPSEPVNWNLTHDPTLTLEGALCEPDLKLESVIEKAVALRQASSDMNWLNFRWLFSRDKATGQWHWWKVQIGIYDFKLNASTKRQSSDEEIEKLIREGIR